MTAAQDQLDAAVIARAKELGYSKPGTPTPAPAPAPSPQPPSNPTPTPQPTVVKTCPICWFRNGANEPTNADVDFAVGKNIAHAVWQPFWPTSATRLRSGPAGTKVYAYMDIMSVRSNAVSLGDQQPTLGLYNDAQTNGWLTSSTMSGYSYQTVWKFWLPEAQAYAVNRAVAFMDKYGPHGQGCFDGIMMDNLVNTTDYYNTGIDPNLLASGALAMAKAVGSALKAKGYAAYANITEGRNDLSRFSDAASSMSGLMDERYGKWTDGTAQGNYATGTDFNNQMLEANAPGNMLAVTVESSDRGAALYGLGEFWLSGAASEGGGWLATGFDDYGQPLSARWRPEYGELLGQPLSPVQASGNLRWRTFTNGLVAVNPATSGSATLGPFSGYRWAGGTATLNNEIVTVAPLTAAILVKQ